MYTTIVHKWSDSMYKVLGAFTFSLRISLFLASLSSFNSDTRHSRVIAEAVLSAISCSCVSNNLARLLGGVRGLYQGNTKPFEQLSRNSFRIYHKLLMGQIYETFIQALLSQNNTNSRRFLQPLSPKAQITILFDWQWKRAFTTGAIMNSLLPLAQLFA